MGQEDLRERIYRHTNHEEHESQNNNVSHNNESYNNESYNNESFRIGSHRRNGAENIIIIVANLVLIFGILAAIILAYQFGYKETVEYDRFMNEYTTRKEILPEGFIPPFFIIIASFVQWAFIKVIANISLNIKDINNKLK